MANDDAIFVDPVLLQQTERLCKEGLKNGNDYKETGACLNASAGLAMPGGKEVKLNIGAGQSYIPRFINIDISDKADIALDLGKDALPFQDSTVDMIFSYHTLEHIPDYLFALSEIHRVLKHGGRFLVGFPYVTLTEFHLINPYHFHNFSEFSFDFFDPAKQKGTAAEKNSVRFTKVFHRFHYVGFFNLVPPPFRTWCRRHLFNVVRKIDFGLIAVKRLDEAAALPSKKTLLREFDTCLSWRRPYRGRLQKRTIWGRVQKKIRNWWHGF